MTLDYLRKYLRQTCSKHDNFVQFAHSLKEFLGSWTDHDVDLVCSTLDDNLNNDLIESHILTLLVKLNRGFSQVRRYCGPESHRDRVPESSYRGIWGVVAQGGQMYCFRRSLWNYRGVRKNRWLAIVTFAFWREGNARAWNSIYIGSSCQIDLTDCFCHYSIKLGTGMMCLLFLVDLSDDAGVGGVCIGNLFSLLLLGVLKLP